MCIRDRIGANAFIQYEYKVLYTVIAVIAVLMAVITTWHAAAALLIGSVMSGSAGFIGMKIATLSLIHIFAESLIKKKMIPFQ